MKNLFVQDEITTLAEESGWCQRCLLSAADVEIGWGQLKNET
jgi:hypothetical protein